MAKRASLKKSAAAELQTPTTVGESLSIEKQELIIRKASAAPKKAKTKSVQRLTIDVPTDIYQKMKELKHDEGITSKGLVVRLLRNYFTEKTV